MNTATSFQTTQYNHAQQTQILGQSGLKIFAGEDLTYGDRKRMQQMQSESWWKQQMQEKERRKNNEKVEKEMYDTQTLKVNEYRRILEQQKANRLRDMEKAYHQTNKQQLNEKISKERVERELDTQQKLQHVEYIQNHDFYTENSDTCKSNLGNNRYLPYHWKGMSKDERKRILEEQAKQIQQKKLQKQIEKQEEKLFGLQMEAQRRALVLTERAKNSGSKQVRKRVDQYNRLKAQEMKRKAYQAFDGVHTSKNE